MNATGFFRTKLWLWVAVTTPLILVAGYIPIVKSGEERFGYWGCWGVVLRGGAFVGTPADTAMILLIQGGMWGLALVAAGWAIHRVLLMALFRGTTQTSSPDRLDVRAASRQKILTNTLIVVAITTPFAACGLAWFRTPPLQKVDLEYPDGVLFYCGQEARWSADDVHNPGPCPLSVHLPGVDLDGAALASHDRLRELGWEVSVVHRLNDGQVYSVDTRSPGQAVECSYIRGRLFSVRVSTHIPATGQLSTESVSVSYRGQRVALPSSNEAIIAVLGPPLAKQ